jgi:hypothetical protein
MLTEPQRQPAFAALFVDVKWERLAMLLPALLTVLCLSAGLGGFLRFAFPAASLAVGVFLYRRRPVTYIEFVWWLWFLTPLAARLVDYQSGWDPRRLMIVAPFLVTCLTVGTLWRRRGLLRLPDYLPFLLACAALLYGLGVGLIRNSPASVIVPLVEWATPVLFGFHLAASRRLYPDFRRVTARAFLWGVLAMGAYGVAQYLFAPAWDRFWLAQTEVTSFGSPEPLGIRVWSTMNSPGTFSIFMMAGLILLFGAKGPLRFAGMTVGYLSLLLTLARTAWGAWLVSFVLLVIPLPPRTRRRVVIGCVLVAAALYPLVNSEPFAELLAARFETFGSLRDDGSFNERLAIYERGVAAVLAEPVGEGIGRTVSDEIIDSALLDLLLTLGWGGALLYFAALAALLYNISRPSVGEADPFLSAARAIAVGITPTLLMASQMVEATGVIYWSFLSLAFAAHRHQQTRDRAGAGNIARL